MRYRRQPSSGFTIIEVMVAIMILAVSVVSIFGAQFAAVATTEFSRGVTHAINLAECKMNEIELQILTEDGFQLGDLEQSGECCEAMSDAELDDFSCEWEIKAVELPSFTDMLMGGDGGLGLMTDLDLGATPDDSTADDMGGDIMGVFESLAPMLSDMMSEGIRRVTVTVRWKQGKREPHFTLSQHVVHPTEGSLGLLNAAMSAAAGRGDDLSDPAASLPTGIPNPFGMAADRLGGRK